MSFVSDFVCENLASNRCKVPDSYFYILSQCYQRPPPFANASFGLRYRELASDTEWFANSLIANSALEGYGSQQIWKFSNRLTNPKHKQAVRKHSLDESRHSSMFYQMLKSTFPGISFSDVDKERIESYQPMYTSYRHPDIAPVPVNERLSGINAVEELVKVHITEIRALVLQHLLRPVLLAYCPPQNQRLMKKASDVLIRDESRHIAYSAEIFDQEIGRINFDELLALFEREARVFDQLTLEELERDVVEI